ncbi:MAG: glycoside hydrolase family 3 C-terminal domain-containing protein [Thermoflexales bacterium]|nr:glycoside hydrolase family 3 C-terminal domain-containing protein [Thermoflexales bacterium]
MSDTPIYQNPNRSIEERVQDLLERMTLEEKVGQMCQINGRDKPEKWLQEHHVGSFLHMLGEETVALQRLAAESRLGIPLLFGIDAIHGHAFWPTGTVFPTQLALSCAWNPELVQQIGRVTAREVAATGVHWTFSPMLDIARDLRWGRIDETFGEDPHLVSVLGAALVRGYQGDELADTYAIAACAKHYAGYSETQGGRDSSEADLSERKMRSLFLRPFQATVEAGSATIMAGYHAIDGVPCSANTWLLRDVLRGEWGFDGMVVSDWMNMDHLQKEQRISPTPEHACKLVVEAGNDMLMNTLDFTQACVQAVKDGQIDMADVDEAVKNVLRLKFRLGLFDDKRYPDLQKGQEIVGCAGHRQLALESAYQSIVLLKNVDDLLPLKNGLKRIAVIGPNADDIQAQLGDWVLFSGQLGDVALARARETVVSVLDGIRARAGEACQVEYCRGCDVVETGTEGIAEAVEAARRAEVAVVVVGDNLALNGETHDRAALDLTGGQSQLLRAVLETGTPTVVVLINGKPLSIPFVLEKVPAVLEAWNPGLEGGNAVAGILFGDRNPSGKLSISFPYHVGQQPVYYNQLPGWHTDRYADMTAEPLLAFGYGLSYTGFAYSKLKLGARELAAGEALEVEVDVTNTGQRQGTEIVQFYIHDLFSSVTRPVKELVDFRRVDLGPGETKTVRLQVGYEQLALINQHLESVVEPGDFEVMVGSSSRDQDLLKETFAAK